ncbi:MAG: hypothetical protein HRT82_17695 [Henriciella sp.]|nr:hypothetical protein [Henriciella sp.]
MQVILLNGPPRSGKDTIGSLLANEIEGAYCDKFAAPIIDHMYSNFGVSCDDGGDKSVPLDVLNGFSRRQYAIAYSERWIKPTLGEDWFGQQAARMVELRAGYPGGRSVLRDNTTPWCSTLIFTDSGFREEAIPVVEAVKKRDGTVVQVQLFRPGCSFNGDSRGYWDLEGVRSIQFFNDGPLDELLMRVRRELVPAIIR